VILFGNYYCHFYFIFGVQPLGNPSGVFSATCVFSQMYKAAEIIECFSFFEGILLFPYSFFF
jgi:hypothetical protein